MNRWLNPIIKYGSVQGRASRSEYWGFHLLLLIGIFLLSFLILIVAQLEGAKSVAGLLFLFFVLGSLIPSMAVGIRRMHDIGKSGWWLFINFIPFVGHLIFLIMVCTKGTIGDNKYGPDPLMK